MQFSQFIFLKRNWEADKDRLAAHLQKLDNPADPMWLLIFPEGTNLHPVTRESSKKWAAKNGIPDMQHQLLPRSRGLQFCIQQLRDTVSYVYDCTIAYEGVSRGEYASEIFTIQAAYFGGKPPKSVNMYWRRFDVSKIPADNPKAFDNWLRARWIEKDQLLEYFQQTGRFPADTGVSTLSNGQKIHGAGYIETEIKPNKWYEYLQVFAPVGLLALILYMFYGALPKRFMKDIGEQIMQESPAEDLQQLEHVFDSSPRFVEVASTNAGSIFGDDPTANASSAQKPVKNKVIPKLLPKKNTPKKSATDGPTIQRKPKVHSAAKKVGAKHKTTAASKTERTLREQGSLKLKQHETKPSVAKKNTPDTVKKVDLKKSPAQPSPSAQAARLKPTPKPKLNNAGGGMAKTGTRPAPKKLEIKAKASTGIDKEDRAPPKKLAVKPKQNIPPTAANVIGK